MLSRKVLVTTVLILTFLLSAGAVFSATHLGVSSGDFVTLVYDRDSGEFLRVAPKESLGSNLPFTIPPGMGLIVTDVDWKFGVLAEGTVTMTINLTNIVPPGSGIPNYLIGPVYFTSARANNDLKGGTNTNLTAGFVAPSGFKILAQFTPSDGVTSEVILRGYLTSYK